MADWDWEIVDTNKWIGNWVKSEIGETEIGNNEEKSTEIGIIKEDEEGQMDEVVFKKAQE